MTRIAITIAVVCLAGFAAAQAFAAGAVRCPNHAYGLHVLIKNERVAKVSCAAARKIDYFAGFNATAVRAGSARWTFAYSKAKGFNGHVVARHGKQLIEFDYLAE
jgi:hypothetical protein